MNRRPHVRERGVALITVLLVVALATAAAATMTARHQFDVRRTGNRIALAQAHQIALGGEAWAIGILARDRRGELPGGSGDDGSGEDDDANPEVDSRDEVWARDLPPIPIEGGQVTGRITDAQGRFNINNLVSGDRVDAGAIARFERLLAVLDLDPAIAQAVVDWLDANSETSYPGGAEDDYYATLDRPYRAANRPLSAASELRMVRGIGAEQWRRLAPHVTALPAATPVNVNTATAVMLRVIVPGLAETEAEQLVGIIEEEPFQTVADFRRNPLVKQARQRSASGGDGADPGGDEGDDALAVGSSYFRVRTDVLIGSIEYRLYSWLARNDNGASRVLRRTRTPN